MLNVFATGRAELAWLNSLGWLHLALLGKLVLAGVLGGAIGFEREMRGKAAGFRTNVLICIGSTLIAAVSTDYLFRLGGPTDGSRIAAQIVSGVGFLGAGTIIQARGNVVGLTTAASLWVAAGIGIALGIGDIVPAIGATFFVLMALVILGHTERRVRMGPRPRELRLGTSSLAEAPGLTELLERRGLQPQLLGIEKTPDGGAQLTFRVLSPGQGIPELILQLLDDPRVSAASSS